MFVFSIIEKIFGKKEEEEEKEEESKEKTSEEIESKEEKPLAPKDLTVEKEEKEIIKSELKPGPFTEKFFDLAPVKDKKKEEKE